MRKSVVTGALVALSVLGSAAPAWAAWPGANGPIAFSSSRDLQRNIYITPGVSMPDSQLTSVNPDDTSPSISPDGQKVVFASRRTDVSMGGVNQIWTMTIGGASQIDISDDSISSTEPSWSADGTKILYTRSETTTTPPIISRTQIWVMDADGANKHPLFPAHTTFNEAQAVWSPTGNRVAFVSTRDGGVSQIYTVSVSATTGMTTGAPIWVSDLAGNDTKPDWSPAPVSGNYWLAFASGASGSREIWKMRDTGADRFQITDNESDNFEPAYSPDGDNIVFTSHPQATTVVYTVSVNTTGGPLVNVTDPTGIEGSNDQPTWGPFVEPPPAVPEVSAALLLPLGMVGIMGAALVVASRRRRPAAFA